jgi:hypothetical protein
MRTVGLPLVRNVAFVTETSAITLLDLRRLVKVLALQVKRDLGPAWQVAAKLQVFGNVLSVPLAYDLITFKETVLPMHWSVGRRAFASVGTVDTWTVDASHELCELLVNPLLKRYQSALSPRVGDQGRLLYQVEVCDPCNRFSYVIDGMQVSDFFLPTYFDDASQPGVRYSHNGSITAPHQILFGGYIDGIHPITGECWRAVGRSTGVMFTSCDGLPPDE